jgi:predicted enzyme related to lactoylglutathione lyase
MRLPRAFSTISFAILLVAGGVSTALCQQGAETTAHAISSTPDVAVDPQYDTTHVYIAPEDFDRFVSSALATFGGTTSKKVVTHVTPTPSSSLSQLILTPVGTISAFGFTTPVPYPYGLERTGYLVTDMETAIRAARQAGADILVTPFNDPIGQDAVIQWPGGVNMQLYTHLTPPSYKALETVPENRVYVSADRADSFAKGFLAFSRGKLASDDAQAPGIEIGRPQTTYRRIRIESVFGKQTVLVTDGQLPYPYGREVTGYEVADLAATLTKAKGAGATVLVTPYQADQREAAIVQFPGGYIAEIHAQVKR